MDCAVWLHVVNAQFDCIACYQCKLSVVGMLDWSVAIVDEGECQLIESRYIAFGRMYHCETHIYA